MNKVISIGNQDFASIREKGCFYVDKTLLIKEWWESQDVVTLITRPRRFGKTLALSMMEYFFSNRYEGRGDLFEGLSIWEDEKYHAIQGSYPVILLSFANVKGGSYRDTVDAIMSAVAEAYRRHEYLLESGVLSETEKRHFVFFLEQSMSLEHGLVSDYKLTEAVKALCIYLNRFYGKKALVFLDEYDAPLQEAYVLGYWDELASFIRMMFNTTFKTNAYMERGLLTGITRVSKESIFSDLNHLTVVTTASEAYCARFGFTEEEVFEALDAQGMPEEKENVKKWYDGFTFGSQQDVYNPWPITNFLKEKRYKTYWANTSSNSLVNKLIREGTPEIKMQMEELLDHKAIEAAIDEEIAFNQLDDDEGAVWSLLLAGGYLKLREKSFDEQGDRFLYWLELTNREVRIMFSNMIRGWFAKQSIRYHDFIRALLLNDVGYMNRYMNQMAMEVFSYFDTGKHASEQSEPERFYHGFVLGLVVDANIDYTVTSNRESGLGRYDVVLEPREPGKDAYVLEFKVFDPDKEKTLEDTVQAAICQIEEKSYDAALIAKGIPRERIRHYGFAFEGKKVLIG